MVLGEPAAAPRRVPVSASLRTGAPARGARGRSPSGRSSPSTVRKRAGSSSRELATPRRSIVNIDHHHDNTRFGEVDLVVDDASSTAEVLADVFEASAWSSTPGARGPRSTSRSSPTRAAFKYANTTPEGPAPRGSAPSTPGASPDAGLREVYESTRSSAKLKLWRGRSSTRRAPPGRRILVSELLTRTDFEAAGARGARTRKASSTTSGGVAAPSSPRLVRELPPGARAARQRLTPLDIRTRRRLGDRAPLRRRWPSAGARDSRPTSRSTRSRAIVARSRHRKRARRSPMPIPKALEPTGIARRQACGPILLRDRRGGPVADGREDRSRRHPRPVRNGSAGPALGPRDEPP